ncbi:pilus assembly protein TadG-related protein [Spongisporangium articulatum]|uniref:Pilus assembly protein TadG-related protein n=1 Tax=Spongisporangium articulatum TaxID=3362603 RepID=A0ABW8ASX1_9ACTN
MRSQFLHRTRRDAGVVTVVFALCVSTFLIGFAALAVDAGTAFARRAQLQSVADRLAVATAGGLPGTDAALADFGTAYRQMCSQEQADGNELWDDCDGSLDWATDRNRANGEVEFLNDTNGGLTFLLNRLVQNRPTQATEVRVTLPPSRVEYAFGGMYGVGSALVSKSATARIGTPMGAGILPFTATSTDVANGQLCIVDPDVSEVVAPNWPVPAPTDNAPGLRVIDPATAKVAFTGDGGQTRVTLRLSFNSNFTWKAQQFKVFYNTSPTQASYLTPTMRELPLVDGWVSYDLTFDVPEQQPGSTVSFWVTGQRYSWFYDSWQKFTSYPTTIDFTGRPEGEIDPCSLPQASGRGYVKLARTGGDAGLDPLQLLEKNVRTGPQVQLYTENALLDLLGSLPVVSDLCVGQLFQPASICLSGGATSGFSSQLKDGLLSGADGSNGRLVGDCGYGTTSAGGTGGVDASRLLSADSPLVDPHFGTGAQLRAKIVSGIPLGADEDVHGWVTGKALSCPRMAVLPVVGNTAPTDPLAVIGAKKITGFVYVWIDGPVGRGLGFNGDQLRSVSAYVIDPRYLPVDVAGSGTVGPYLGDSMPKEVTLVCTLDVPTGGDTSAGCKQ